MLDFSDGETFHDSFRAKSGWMGFMAEVAFRGAAVVLSDIDYKPLHTRVLRVSVAETLAFADRLLAQAVKQGYTSLVLEGVRTSGKNPNRQFRYGRKS